MCNRINAQSTFCTNVPYYLLPSVGSPILSLGTNKINGLQEMPLKPLIFVGLYSPCTTFLQDSYFVCKKNRKNQMKKAAQIVKYREAAFTGSIWLLQIIIRF